MKKRKNNGFYNNKNRNTKWTEEEIGRKIEFADKYEHPEADPVNNKSVKRRTAEIEAKRQKKIATKIFFVFVCILSVCLGYTTMQIHSNRLATPINNRSQQEITQEGYMQQISLDVKALNVESISLDGSVMLSSIISEAENLGFSGITFDAKRADGSIGYQSTLATVDTYNAVTLPAKNLSYSVAQLTENDILAAAKICCYKDNVVPMVTTDFAIMTENGIYTDSNGNTYLNPNSSSTYNYLKDIITECYENGITVFVLYGCDLPEEISESYNDGFDYLANKLNNEFDGKIRLYEAVETELSENEVINTSSYSEEYKNSTKINLENLNSNQVYYIKSQSNKEDTVAYLEKIGINAYILED